jgi:hypothetical protein
VTVQIIEIMGRSEQGITKPFICRGDDKQVYFVKGRGAGRRSQICEWVGGVLGQKLGLPIAKFEIVDVPEELLEDGAMPNLGELGAGLAFGSRKFLAVELTPPAVDKVSLNLQREILAFDWWIRNGDRMLTRLGGNPNLFWSSGHELVMIDHNQAFDRDFSKRDFFKFHAFNGQSGYILGDLSLQDRYRDKFTKVLNCLEAIWNTIPQEWGFVDPEATVATDFNIKEVRDLLMQCHSDGFWKLP